MSVTVSELSFAYARQPALSNVSFHAADGAVTAVLGANGAGKSTLFQCILGLLIPNRGTVTLDGQRICGLSAKSLAQRVAYIPQTHYPAFNYTVLDMVLMGTTAQVSGFASPGQAQRNAAHAALERVGIADFASRAYLCLSGGERQLVLIARALAQSARLLVMDEPTASLDYGNQHRMLALIRTLAREGYAVLVSMHNPDQAFRYADHVLALDHGAVAAFGEPQEVLNDALIERMYGLNAHVFDLPGKAGRVCVPISLD